MEYRHLGRSGLQVSVLSFGSWVTFGGQIGTELAVKSLNAAREGGINFFDNAESYAQGESERIMGKALAELGWPRHSFVISTKLFWGIYDDINMRNTTNRKYLLQAIDGSLERLGLDFVDILYCHRSDPGTPIEETVWAMSDIIAGGKALYWGTSEWPADDIRAAWEIAERHHLRKPIAEQPQYNLLARQRVEREYARLYDEIGLGLTIWSPLASGLLTGKYLEGSSHRQPGLATGLRVAPGQADGRVPKCKGTPVEAGGRRPGLRHGSACSGLVRPQPTCVNRHHGGVEPRPAHLQPWCPGRPTPHHRRHRGTPRRHQPTGLEAGRRHGSGGRAGPHCRRR